MKCYIKDCDYIGSDDAARNNHDGLRFSEKYGVPSCWWHEKGYFHTEQPEVDLVKVGGR